MLSNVGILASSFQSAAGLATFSTGATFGTLTPNYFGFAEGTAIISMNGTGSRYGDNLFGTALLGGSKLNTPYKLWAANGVAIAPGRPTAGTVTLMRTTDGGQTWGTVLDTASTSDFIDTITYASVGGTARWVAPVYGDNDVYLSTDNGASFTLQSNVLGSTARSWRQSIYMGTAFAVFAISATQYYTSANGATWTLRTLPVTFGNSEAEFRQFAASSDTAMMISNGSVVYTTSDLINWTLTGTIPANTGAFDFQTASLAFGNGYWVAALQDGAGGSQLTRIFYSNNNGTSWSESTVQGSASFTSMVDLAFNSVDNGFYAIARIGTTNNVLRAIS